MTREIAVLVPDGDSPFAGPVIQCLARRPEIRVHLASQDRWSPARFSRHCTTVHRLEGDDSSRLESLATIVRRQAIDVLLPVSEEGLRWVIEHRASIEELVSLPPLPPLESFDEAGDKGRLSKRLHQWGLPQPRTVPCTRNESFERSLTELPFPVLVKARRGGGGRHIFALESRAALDHFLSERPDIREQYVVQQLHPGTDVSCNVLARNGKVLAVALYEGRISNPRRFGPPIGVEFIEDDATRSLVERLIERLDWSGYADVDLIRDGRTGQVYFLEVNTRFWSSLLASEAAGVNFPHLACLAALGQRFERPRYRHIGYLPVLPGIRHAIRGWWGEASPRLPLARRDLQQMITDPLPVAIRSIQKRWNQRSKVTRS